MASLISELRTKVRALSEDLSKKQTETFTYSSGDKVFTLQEENANSITSIN